MNVVDQQVAEQVVAGGMRGIGPSWARRIQTLFPHLRLRVDRQVTHVARQEVDHVRLVVFDPFAAWEQHGLEVRRGGQFGLATIEPDISALRVATVEAPRVDAALHVEAGVTLVLVDAFDLSLRPRPRPAALGVRGG